MLKVTRLNGWAVATGLVLMLGTGIANASTISVINLDFGPTAVTSGYSTIDPYHSVTGDTGNTTWNKVQDTDVASGGVAYGNGLTATGVSINVGLTNSTAAAPGPINTYDSVLGTQPDKSASLQSIVNGGIYATPQVLSDAIFYSDGSKWVGVSLQVSGLTPGTYNIYYTGQNNNLSPTANPTTDTIYAGQSNIAGDFNFATYTSDTISHTIANTASFVPEVNYAKVTINLATGNYLNLAFVGDANNAVDKRGFLNSLQIEQVGTAVPEPASLGLLGLGAGLLLLRKRQRAC